jgi:4-hydroxymandelate oxidase
VSTATAHGELPTADELEQRARDTLPAAVFDFIEGGAGSERAVTANRTGFDRFALRPRVLAGIDRPVTETNVLGVQLAAPIFVAPMGTHRLVHEDGERATAAACAAAGVGYIASSAASVPLEETASATSWFQLYVLSDRKIAADMIRRADAAGYRALCLTVDVPVIGRRYRDLRNAFEFPDSVRRVNLDPYVAIEENTTAIDDFPERAERALGWKDIAWIRELTDLPIVLKGVLTAEDARLAIEHGIDAIYVSNHGGRQLGTVAATIDVLEEVAAAAAGRIPIVVDGGIRSASDAIIALSLGADAVAVGRPVLWALATGGGPNVEAFLSELISDLARTLHLLGRPSVRSLDSTTVGRTP